MLVRVWNNLNSLSLKLVVLENGIATSENNLKVSHKVYVYTHIL